VRLAPENRAIAIYSMVLLKPAVGTLRAPLTCQL
jgi:hypothetical protein